jgi:hypothetical protein
MAEFYVQDPKTGEVVIIDESQAQAAADQGYRPVDDATIRKAQEHRASGLGAQAAAAEGLGQLPEGYNVPQAFAEKALSAATFGQFPGLDSPEAIASGRKFQEERPGLAMVAEGVGQLPLALAAGAAGGAAVGAARGAGLGRAAMAGVGAADFAAQAAVGGLQTEAEQTRLAQDEFSFTDAAITGVVGEALGRGAAYTLAKSVGGARNLVARAARDVVAEDAAESLAKGGWLNDYRVAQHAEAYHNELAELAARDLDELETSFEEVSRQDRKRGRITRVVADDPAVQAPVRAEAAQSLAQLRDALSDELADAGGPARKLLKQLDERIAKLEEAPTGKRLWRVLDENRQALQEYRQDLHQAYESNPGSAWLSREGLAAIDAAEKATREALLREDVWGEAAARMQREYNTPFHEKYFPTVKTVRNDLMFAPHENAEGFKVFQGDPAKVKRFLARDVASPDGHRLGEQFRSYLDGVEAIARAGQSDTPQAAHRVLEAVRRLRKAQANAQFVSAAAERAGKRAAVGEVVADVAAGAAGAATFGVPGAVGFAGASRGLRIGHWLSKAASKLGLGSGEALSMAKLLERDALPAPSAADRPFVDDLAEAEVPRGPSSTPPDDGGGEPLDVGIFSDAPPSRPTSPDLSTAPPAESGVSLRPDRAARASRPTEPVRYDRNAPDPDGERPTLPAGAREVHRNQDAALAMDELRNVRGVAQREAKRLEALAEGEFQDVVRSLRSSGEPEARELAEAGLVRKDRSTRAYAETQPPSRQSVRSPEAFAATEAPAAGPSLDDVAAFYQQKVAAQSPDLAKFLAKAGDSVKAGSAKASNWWENMLADTAPKENPASLPPPRRTSQFKQALRDKYGADAPADVVGAEDVADGILAKRVGRQGGVTAGGFYTGTDGVTRYVKFADRMHQLTELANNEAYRDFGVRAVQQEIKPLTGPKEVLKQQVPVGAHLVLDREASPVALYSEQLPEVWKPVDQLTRADVKPEAVREYVRGVPADIVLGNWDIANNAGNILTDGAHVLRLDAGEAGANSLFSMKAGPEWREFVDRMKGGRLSGVSGMAGDETLDVPAQLVNATAPAEAKAALVEGIDAIEKVVNQHGSFGRYVEHRFPHLDPPRQKALAKDMAERFDFLKENIDALAGLALFIGASALAAPPAEEGEAAPAGAAAAGGLFAARAGLFKAARGKLVAEVAKRLFSSTAEPAAKVAARLVYSRTQLKARQEEFQQWAQNPQELVERVAEGFRDVPPEHSGTVASGVFRAASFLKQRLPTVAKLNAISLRQIPVSQDAMLKFARYEQAALRPREAWQNAAAGGHVSAELLETTEELYPDLLAELRVGAIQTVQENGPPTTVQGRLAYARLFDGNGALADPAFSQTVANMTAYAYEQAVPTQPGGGPTSSGNVSHVAAASAPPAGVGAARLT